MLGLPLAMRRRFVLIHMSPDGSYMTQFDAHHNQRLFVASSGVAHMGCLYAGRFRSLSVNWSYLRIASSIALLSAAVTTWTSGSGCEPAGDCGAAVAAGGVGEPVAAPAAAGALAAG